VPKSKEPNPEAVFSSSPKALSIGNSKITANTLKKSCTVAAENARLNSFPRLICPMETIILVTVVPILAPIIMGIAPPKFNAPLLTIPTINAVVVDEL
jgi:hypothetical protein